MFLTHQAMFLSRAFLSNWALYILSKVIFFKIGWCVLRDYRLDVLRQRVLRNASSLQAIMT